jgi:hypothetical protein
MTQLAPSPHCSPTKQRIADKLMWLAPDSGLGLGVCSIGNSDIWSSQRPSGIEPDWKSVVFIKGPHEKYTIEELKKLLKFSQEKTAKYDKMFKVRMGANIIIIDKQSSVRWLRKRMTWEYGPMHSETLDEAIATFMEKGN